MTVRRFIPARCHPDRPHEARGLCCPCYDHARYLGEHRQVERRTRCRDELVADAEQLRRRYPRQPLTWRQIAARLGVAPTTLDRARVRARSGPCTRCTT